MGAQRWINLGFMKLQPSELMKVALVLTLARYFHAATPEDMKRLSFLIVPRASDRSTRRTCDAAA